MSIRERVDDFVEDQFQHGECIRCRAPAANHVKMSPACWVNRLIAILEEQKDD